MPTLSETCARDLMDTIPLIMQTIREDMRQGRGADLSIPQFRALRYIQRNTPATLSQLADHLGLTSPSVSKMVDGLVHQRLVTRQEAASDRRQLALALTAPGEAVVNRARARAQRRLAKILQPLPAAELRTLQHVVEQLHPLFAKD